MLYSNFAQFKRVLLGVVCSDWDDLPVLFCWTPTKDQKCQIHWHLKDLFPCLVKMKQTLFLCLSCMCLEHKNTRLRAKIKPTEEVETVYPRQPMENTDKHHAMSTTQISRSVAVLRESQQCNFVRLWSVIAHTRIMKISFVWNSGKRYF